MRYMTVCAAVLALLAASAARGNQMYDPAYAEVRTGERVDIPSYTTDTDIATRLGEARQSGVFDHAAAGRGVDTERARPGPAGELDWGNDILLRSGSIFPQDVGRLSIDHAANGDLYASVLTLYGAPQDTLHIFRSTNHGVTWQPWAPVINTAGSDTLIDGKIVIGPGANPWTYTFAHYATSGGGLYCRRLRADQTGLLWTVIIRGDSVRDFDADRNIESPPVLFLTYNELTATGHNRVRLFASYDSSATWTNGRNVHVGTGNPVSLCAGGDGYVYVSWVDDSVTPWVGRYTNNLVSPSFTFAHPDSVAGDFVYQPTVCAARTAPGASQVAWILNRHLHTNGNYDLHVSRSTNGGASWSTAPWPPTNTARPEWNMRHPKLRYPYDYAVALCVASATLGGAYDSLITGFSRVSTPDTWEGRFIVNDYDCTRAFASAIDCQIGAGGTITIYRQYGSDRVWYDYWWNTGMAEERPLAVLPEGLELSVSPNPVAGRAAVRYSLAAPGTAELALFDVSGRRRALLARGASAAGDHFAVWNSAGCEPGVYLLRLTAGGESVSRRVVVAH